MYKRQVPPHTGAVIEQGNVKGALEVVRMIEKKGKSFYRQTCRDYALAHFNKEERYADYMKLYDELTQK
mgnify:FL=1